MKRWCYNSKTLVEEPQVDKFIEEVIALYDKYGLSISHEDSYGGFIIIHSTDLSYKEWINSAGIINDK
jgi:hypothetical protein